MPIYNCPKDPNHLSTDPDYCSVCGTNMDGSSLLGSAPSAANSSNGVSGASTLPPVTNAPATPLTLGPELCPVCGTERLPGARFCEVCRHNFETGGSQPLGTGSPSVLAPSSSSAPVVPSIDMTPPVFLPGDTSLPIPDRPARSDDLLDAPSGINNSGDVAPSGSVSPSGETATTDGTESDAPHDSAALSVPADAGALNGLVAPISPASTSNTTQWQITIIVDPALYTPDPSLPLPVGQPDLVFPLELSENLIGRRTSRRDSKPDVPISDPGVSHRHAKLYREADGTWSLLELGSTNGTRLNGANVQPGVRETLHDGDQITLGCWTRLALREVH